MRITPILILTFPFMFLSAHFLPATPYYFPNCMTNSCTHYWWSYFLHIQNYVNVDQLVRKLCQLIESIIKRKLTFSLSVQSSFLVPFGRLPNVSSDAIFSLFHLEMEQEHKLYMSYYVSYCALFNFFRGRQTGIIF